MFYPFMGREDDPLALEGCAMEAKEGRGYLYVAHSVRLSNRCAEELGEKRVIKFGFSRSTSRASVLEYRFNNGFGVSGGRTFPLALCDDWKVLRIWKGCRKTETAVFALLGEPYRFELADKMEEEAKGIDAARAKRGWNGIGEIRCLGPRKLALIKNCIDQNSAGDHIFLEMLRVAYLKVFSA